METKEKKATKALKRKNGKIFQAHSRKFQYYRDTQEKSQGLDSPDRTCKISKLINELVNVANKMKTNKSFLKRIKVTKNGKLVTRKIGQNHFNAKNRTRTTLRKRATVLIEMKNKDRGRFLNNL